MKYYVNKFQSVFNEEGVKGILFLILLYPIKLAKKKTLELKILFAKSPEKKFQIIFRNNYWNENETVSGEGSTMDNTENIRNVMPKILIELNMKYSNSNISFIQKNIIEDNLEYHDLLIVRDLLVHLPNSDIIKVINNYIDSKIPYLLISNYCNSDKSINPDIHMGFFRNVSLQKEPFNIKEDPIYKIDDSTPFIKRELCLWSRKQIINSVSLNKY